jgi:hypothetical protein
MGESRLALDYLLAARRGSPNAQGLGFELAFAYKALHQFDRTIEAASEPLARDASDQTRERFNLIS